MLKGGSPEVRPAKQTVIYEKNRQAVATVPATVREEFPEGGCSVVEVMEAPSGFEPLHKGFADLSLSHLGTAPRQAGTSKLLYYFDPRQLYSRCPPRASLTGLQAWTPQVCGGTHSRETERQLTTGQRRITARNRGESSPSHCGTQSELEKVLRLELAPGPAVTVFELNSEQIAGKVGDAVLHPRLADALGKPERNPRVAGYPVIRLYAGASSRDILKGTPLGSPAPVIQFPTNLHQVSTKVPIVLSSLLHAVPIGSHKKGFSPVCSLPLAGTVPPGVLCTANRGLSLDSAPSIPESDESRLAVRRLRICERLPERSAAASCACTICGSASRWRWEGTSPHSRVPVDRNAEPRNRVPLTAAHQ